MAAESLSIPSAWELDWQPLDTSRDGNVPGPVIKLLRRDEETGGMTFMTHLPPGWKDDLLDWHPSVEEGFILAGACRLADRLLDEDCYLYRPPGILHGPVGAPHDAGATILQRMDKELRILRYEGDTFPHEDSQPITKDHERWPVEWTEKLDTKELLWEAVESGGWAGARIKWLHRNRETGGGLVLLDLPSGWRGGGSEARGDLEEFVVSGSVDAGGVRYGKWGYAFRPAGKPAAEYATDEGARLACWWNGADEL
jgi:hypothetical protein